MKDIFLSPLISNGMIIQRDSPFPIRTKKKISAVFLNKTYESQNINDNWLITLVPAKAGGPYEMLITLDGVYISIKNIYIGDVWLCSGQSNMETPMQRLFDDFGEEWDIKNFPVIRQFKVPQECDFSAAREDLSGGNWLSASSETLNDFSAAAWFFAKNLWDKYQIPVGLINTAWGGTPVESWMSTDALADYPLKIADSREFTDMTKRGEIAKKTASAIYEWESNLKNNDYGLIEDWKNPNIDINSWSNITLPGDFSAAGLPDFCGVIWLAKDFEINPAQNAKIWLGTIVDADTVFINGIETGSTTYRYPPRKYSCSGLLKHGKNRIVIRVTCNNGEGGITTGKPFRIFTDNETVELSGLWKYKIAVSAKKRPEDFFFQRLPAGNYNAMVAPVLKFPLKGVIWYQGESNEQNANEYAQLFKLMIQDWRKKNNNENLPFLFVQLPVFCPVTDNDEQNRWPVLREAQKEALSLPVTGMAAALELGEWNDIHPINKKDVGFRLFLAADKVVFANENSSPGPMLKDTCCMEYDNESRKIYLHFKNCGDGLCVFNESLVLNVVTNAFLRTSEIDISLNEKISVNAYVSVTGDDGQIRLPAEIEGTDTISIDISSIKNPKKILYAWADNPRDRQLFNSDGLPMLPFRIEIKKE